MGNCAVVDAKPGDGLKIIGDQSGYVSSSSASKALENAKAECKGAVGSGAEAKLKAAKQKQRSSAESTN
jgi:hypothetical protein